MQTRAHLGLGTPIVIVLAAAFAPAAAQQSDQPAAPAAPEQLLAQFKAAGRDAALTVFPAGLLGRPVRPVGDALALLLERAGMQNLEIDAPEFQPPAKADLAGTVAAFGEFVKAHPPQTDYALFAEVLGSHEKGVAEVRTVVTDRQGALVWQDRQTPDDPDFRKVSPREPMECCVLVVERLRPVLGLADPTRAAAPAGKLARHWAQKSGTPDKAERDAITERQQAFKQAAPKATVWVYPALAGEEVSQESAAQLAQLLNDAGLTKAVVAEQGPQLEIKGDSNEQKVLWDMAGGVRAFVRAHRPDAGYVLFAHYLMGRNASGAVTVSGVHFVVCDRDGAWVIVDFQNNHHGDFNAIDPKSRADCDRLVAKRLAGYCR
ncbi:MAG: hypothetical protein AB1716_06620 [Planctomycetota bacterium]